jgi:hypothetical protein
MQSQRAGQRVVFSTFCIDNDQVGVARFHCIHETALLWNLVRGGNDGMQSTRQGSSGASRDRTNQCVRYEIGAPNFLVRAQDSIDSFSTVSGFDQIPSEFGRLRSQCGAQRCPPADRVNVHVWKRYPNCSASSCGGATGESPPRGAPPRNGCKKYAPVFAECVPVRPAPDSSSRSPTC